MRQLVVINRDFLFACLRGLFVPPRLEVRDVEREPVDPRK